MAANFLYGEALKKHIEESDIALDEYWREREDAGCMPSAELDLDDFSDILGDKYPEWQMRTECVTAFVENKGWTLEDALLRFKLTENEYHINLSRLERGEGTNF